MNLFVLAIIIAASGQQSIVLPLVAYETEEACDKKIKIIEEQHVFKNKAVEFECFAWDKFQKEQEEKEKKENL